MVYFSSLLVEDLLGIAFVVAQTYIAGTVADAKRIVKSLSKVNKETLLRQHSEKLLGFDLTKIEICDAMANYYKHHEEWPDWSVPGRHQKTVSILRSICIEQSELVPFDKVMGLLWPENKEFDLEPLLLLIANWRTKVIQACLEEIKK
jgi:hypothetical protein